VKTEHLFHLLARIFFVVALAMLALVAIELVLNAAGYTLLRDLYTKGRLLELAATMVVFVIAILLRQIRDQLKGGRQA